MLDCHHSQTTPEPPFQLVGQKASTLSPSDTSDPTRTAFGHSVDGECVIPSDSVLVVATDQHSRGHHNTSLLRLLSSHPSRPRAPSLSSRS